MLFMRAGWKRFQGRPGRQNEAMEARSVLGVRRQGVHQRDDGLLHRRHGGPIWRFQPRRRDVDHRHGRRRRRLPLPRPVLRLLVQHTAHRRAGGFPFSHYAILKNEILGIDEQLRRTFSALCFFATLGGIALLTTSEVIEGFVPGGGLAAGLIVGAPLVVLRKPIFNAIQNFSSVLMPEAFTAAEKSYLKPTKSPWKTESSQRSVNSEPFRPKRWD